MNMILLFGAIVTCVGLLTTAYGASNSDKVRDMGTVLCVVGILSLVSVFVITY